MPSAVASVYGYRANACAHRLHGDPIQSEMSGVLPAYDLVQRDTTIPPEPFDHWLVQGATQSGDFVNQWLRLQSAA
jgi:hypothetical protein